MSEATASTNIETTSAPSDSGPGSSFEAGESGPAEATDRPGDGLAANDIQLQSDTTAEASAELSGTSSAEAGEGVPAEFWARSITPDFNKVAGKGDPPPPSPPPGGDGRNASTPTPGPDGPDGPEWDIEGVRPKPKGPTQ